MVVATTATSAQSGVRKRKTHRKSRGGCHNCKLRRVKCDEAKPKCDKCVSYGVDCSYDAKPEGDLQLSVKGAFMLDVPQSLSFSAPSADCSNLEMINTSLTKKYADLPFRPYRLTMTDLDVLKRFQTRTVMTIGTTDTCEAYRDEVVRLASCHPFLMHILLTLTLVHDRYLAKGSKLGLAEAFHWYQGTALFSYILSKPIKQDERDAIWACAALLGAVAFSSVEVTGPEDAWPLRAPSDSDLDWLQMSDGKKEIARLAYPDGPDSLFYKPMKLACFNAVGVEPAPGCKFESFSQEFIEYYELDQFSSCSDNPYYKAATKLNDLLPHTVNHTTILSFFQYIGHVQPEYKALLKQKDPRAMLLLAYWYAKLCEYKQWWVFTRAFVECQSICIYLKRYHWSNPKMWKLIKFPISRCGLEGANETSNKHWIFPS